MSKKNIKQLKKDLNLPDYKLNYDAEVGGTHLVGHIHTNYQSLEDAFGEPTECDEYKVSGEWRFKDNNSKEVFTIYDWKQTSLYDADYPTVDEFREDLTKTDFSVGGKTDATKFIDWVHSKLNK